MMMSLVSRFWQMQALCSVFLLILWNLFLVRSGAVVPVVQSAGLGIRDIFAMFIYVFYVLFIFVILSYGGCGACVSDREELVNYISVIH
jgi:hypothetical protein